ncbi:MAG: patatin-like phospholipase family protein [Parvibaculum sp.]|uniref:patatin-like phospholipase family protein n=1 Tax=Parvibaculum sp. TaxID=2024848 RepID=UPI0025F86026|nr:patatin-like phospholipase family protein [Parvibaculum sp.]MCE9651310.1 patatin-like phospholipase family protein [Parvibaculum sp.]
MTRPKIGIALGSGVARGWAHIGVLKALTRAGIEPDIISGTSIGALVGGCHLANKMEPLEAFARSLNRRRLLGLIDFRFRSSGLIGDSKLEALMREYLGDLNIEDLDRTFVGVATELATGHEVWLREGNLVQAIRASYALPGVFAPVPIDNRWLIDGAIVNPVPVSVTRALGARLVIAVNLNTDPFDPATRRHFEQGKNPFYVPRLPPLPDVTDLGDELAEMVEAEAEASIGTEAEEVVEADENSTIISGIRGTLSRLRGGKRDPEREIVKRAIGTRQRGPGFASVMLASLNIVQDRLARARLASDPPDVVIAPKIGHLTLLEFDRADELIRLGEEAAEEAMPLIRETIGLLQ